MLGLVTPHAIASGKTAVQADQGQEPWSSCSKHTRTAHINKIGKPQARLKSTAAKQPCDKQIASQPQPGLPQQTRMQHANVQCHSYIISYSAGTPTSGTMARAAVAQMTPAKLCRFWQAHLVPAVPPGQPKQALLSSAAQQRFNVVVTSQHIHYVCTRIRQVDAWHVGASATARNHTNVI